MFHTLLAQADDTANAAAAGGLGIVAGIFFLVFAVAYLAYLAFYFMAIAKLSTAAGYPAINGILVALVPVYNLMWLYKLYTRAGENGWKLLLQFIPIYGIICLNQLASKIKAMPTTTVGFAPSV